LSNKKELHTNIDAELLKKLKLLAVEREVTLNKLIEEIFRQYFDRN
jgi:hypothetical protein